MKCRYCLKEMEDFTESYLCCFNDNCPYLIINPEEKKSSEGLRSYIKLKKELSELRK